MATGIDYLCHKERTGNKMTDEKANKFENEEQHRSRLNQNIGSILEPLPLNGSGNPFVKTFEQAMIVALAKEGGAINEDIAAMIGIQVSTLTKHFKEELANADEYLNRYIRKGMMTSAKRAIDGDARYNPVLLRVAAVRCGMSERIQQDNVSSDGSMSPGGVLNGLPVGSRLVIETPPPADSAKPATKPTEKPVKPATKAKKTPK